MANLEAQQPDAPCEGLIGESAPMRRLRQLIRRAAPTGATVLLTGETGSGKGVAARALHRLSRRCDGAFVHVDCGALSASLIESELFGHERGAFTGAVRRRAGRFELAREGTIFLDEIAALPAALQGKLMRVLEDREFERVGGVETLPMRARVIAATSRDLRRAVRDGQFRADLYFRLDVVTVRVPPLRERVDDLPLLVCWGLARGAARLGAVPPTTTPAFRTRLAAHRWPGNVRELMNLLERLTVARPGERLDAAALDDALLEIWPGVAAPGPVPASRCETDARRSALVSVLVECGGNVSRAARRLRSPLACTLG